MGEQGDKIDELITELEKIGDDLAMEAGKEGNIMAKAVGESVSKMALSLRVEHRSD